MGSLAIENFLGELLGFSAATTAIHAITNAFLVYKGSKASEAFLSDTARSSLLSTTGGATGMGVEMILNQIAWIGGFSTSVLVFITSLSTRAIAKRVLKRGDAVDWVSNVNKNLEHLTIKVQAA